VNFPDRPPHIPHTASGPTPHSAGLLTPVYSCAPESPPTPTADNPLHRAHTGRATAVEGAQHGLPPRGDRGARARPRRGPLAGGGVRLSRPPVPRGPRSGAHGLRGPAPRSQPGRGLPDLPAPADRGLRRARRGTRVRPALAWGHPLPGLPVRPDRGVHRTRPVRGGVRPGPRALAPGGRCAPACSPVSPSSPSPT
jgi:hypothetical protein